MNQQNKIKEEILEALAHPEAEEGLYLDNLYHLHEEDERRKVSGTDLEILDALRELIQEGKVATDESGEAMIFRLNRS